MSSYNSLIGFPTQTSRLGARYAGPRVDTSSNRKHLNMALMLTSLCRSNVSITASLQLVGMRRHVDIDVIFLRYVDQCIDTLNNSYRYFSTTHVRRWNTSIVVHVHYIYMYDMYVISIIEVCLH